MKQTAAILRAIIELITDTGGPYDPAALFVGLFQSITDSGQDTVLADLTQATGGAATRVAVTPFSTAYRLSDGRWAVEGPACAFAIASSSEEQTVVGWFLATAATAGTLKAWGMLEGAFNFVDEYSHLSLVPRITVDPNGDWDATIQING